VKLTKAGDRFFDFQTGEAYNPTNPILTDAQFTLTAPDGTIYKIHAVNGITEQQFTNGKTFILSDSGFTAVGTGETVQFIWDASRFTNDASRLSQVIGPDGHRIVYSYDQQGDLVSARDLSTGDTSRYGYDTQNRLTLVTKTGQPGSVIEYPDGITRFTFNVSPVTSDLGAVLNYLANPYSTTLTAGSTDRLVFSVRPSELNATNSGDVYVGVIVEDLTGSGLLPAVPSIAGLTLVASNTSGSSAFGLFRVEREGMYLLDVTDTSPLTPNPSRNYSVKLFIAADVNSDTKVDGLDGQLLTDALARPVSEHSALITQNSALDSNRDGRLDSSDIHLYRQNLGFIPNQAPVANNAAAKTHQDLELIFPVEVSNSALSTQNSALLFDAEGDPTTYRIVGATNGTARIASDGSSVSFTPATGFFGEASFSIVADDGYSTSQVATVTVNVSDAPLVKLDFVARAPRLSPRASQVLQLVGDFADEQNVLLPASYLQFQSTNPTAGIVTLHASRATLHGLTEGTGIITASTAHGPGGVTIQAATAFSIGIPTDQTQQFLYALGLDVFPGAVSLTTGGGQRQILADLADTIQLTNGSTGTRYFVSNPNVVTVSADGLITANQAGDAIITVINGPAESLIPVKVQAPNVGPTLIGTEGGIVQGTNNYQVAIAPNALDESTLVSITPVTQASLPLAMPGPFQYVSSFDLQIGGDKLAIPAQLAIPITGSTLAPNSDIVFFRYTTLPNMTGGTFGVWMQEETGIFGADGVARTASPPFPGVLKSGTWMIAGAPAGSVARVDGEINTFFPNQGSHFTVVAQTAGAPIARDVNSPVQFYLPIIGPITINTFEYTPTGQANVTTTTVQAQAGVNTQFTQTVINSFVDTATDPSGVPVIQTAQVAIANGEAELILTGSRFTFDVPDPSAPNVGASILDLVVNFDVPIRPDQFTQAQLDQFKQDGVPVPSTFHITATPDPLTSSGNTVHVKVPKGVILGLADVSVTRKTPVLQSTSPNVWKVEDRTSDTTTVQADVHILFAADNFDRSVAAVDISKDPLTGQRRNQVITRIDVGDPILQGPTRSVAVTPDLTRAYVTTGQGIALIDVQTLQAVDLNPATPEIDHIIHIPGARPYWAVADKEGNYLYVSDANVGVIYVIDINPTSQTFHKVVKNIAVDVAPEGLRGMDVTADGRRLYAAAPVKGGAAQFSTQHYPDGKIVVIDIDTTPGNKTLWTKITDQSVSEEPYFVKASETDPRVVTFTNRRSDPNGFGVLHATNEAHTNLNVSYASLKLGSGLDHFDVNDASAIALLPAGTLPGQTKDYAFVTGWNRIQQDVISRDPYMIERLTVDEIASGGFILGAPVGGNIGVIEDPFGTPKLIAATAGEFLSMPDGLTISPDGKTLYAAFSAQNAVRVFDVQKIMTQITNSQNLVPQYTRRDGKFNTLEIRPLAGPAGLGVNVPLDASIELAPIGTGRFPQGLALAEANKVIIGFGRENDALNTTILPEAEKGDTTPVFRWNVQWSDPKVRDRATSKLFVSTFKSGQGLFPSDSGANNDGSTPLKDLGLHRILSGVEAKHRFTQQGDFFEYDLEVERGELRALTLGQTYYIGIKVYDGRNELATAWREFKLEQAPATTPFSSVTVLTHGFETRLALDQSRPPDAFVELARNIRDAAGGGVVAVYRKETGDWIRIDDGQSLRVSPPELGKSLVLVSDWMRESDIADEGFAEAAGDAIFASLVKLNNELGGAIFGRRTDGVQSTHPQQSPIHFISHSRGTVVNSEIIQRLGSYVPSVGVRMTTLDPHDFNQPSLNVTSETLTSDFIRAVGGPAISLGLSTSEAVIQRVDALKANLRQLLSESIPQTIFYGEFYDPDVTRWGNVIFADNYYQKAAKEQNALTFTPNGRSISNMDVDVALSGIPGLSPARAGFMFDDFSTQPLQGMGGPHSRVWMWYAGTVGLGLSDFEEPIYRSLADKDLLVGTTKYSLFDGVQVPWYVANEYPSNGTGTFPFSSPDAVWEGIGEGWAFAPQGGAVFQGSIHSGVNVATDNPVTDNPVADQAFRQFVHPDGLAVETVFNGNFEHGFLNPQRFPSVETGTPGWSFHQDFQIVLPDGTTQNLPPIKLVPLIGGGHVAELDSEIAPLIVHNRLYIPSEAQTLQFDFSSQASELGRDAHGQNIVRIPEVKVFVRVGSQEYELAPATISVPSDGQPGFLRANVPLLAKLNPSDAQSPSLDLHGRVESLLFRISLPGSAPTQVLSPARIWIDNVKLRLPGTPVMAGAVAEPTINASSTVTTADISPLMTAALAQWMGSVAFSDPANLIELPDWIAGTAAGFLMVSAPDLALDHVAASWQANGSQQNWDARGSEGGLDNQLFLVNVHSGDEQVTVDKLWIDGDSPLPTDSHAIQAQPDAGLSIVEGTSPVASVKEKHGSVETDIDPHPAMVDGLPVGVSNFNVGFNPSIPSSDESLSDLEIFNLEEFPFLPFKTLSGLVGQGSEFIGSNPFFNAAPGLGQGENEDNQSTLQHSLSFGSQTLQPDRNLVNQSEATSYPLDGARGPEPVEGQPSALSAEQLAWLNKATINIADLVDGYLALTLGTTITLDTDAAGYGWFVDPTPLAHEEFMPAVLSLSKDTPWQLIANPDGAAAGHIDLMTVLLHELGHVMGLGHVSSAVDGTRLMAGSIDPGIRRLPSALDLGAPSNQPSAISDQHSDSHIWDPYLAHYTPVTPAISDQLSAISSWSINPARLVQAAQTPSHEGLFNSNFAISPEPVEGGWDQSGAVTIANGQAVLSEDERVLSTLSQTFALPAGASHLRFTILDIALSHQPSAISSGPSDAFEVALLETNTLTPLAGVVSGLTQTDSLLNIQADGTMFLAPGVTVTPLASSPSPHAWLVDIDLTGITAGAGARLSFDLLGFGDHTSTVVLDNVLLTNGQPTAAPIAVNDNYTVPEGAPRLGPSAKRHRYRYAPGWFICGHGDQPLAWHPHPQRRRQLHLCA
jgi:hypothetical protein